MAVFAYKAVDLDDTATSGTVVADTPRQARDVLRERGLTITQIAPVAAAKVGSFRARRRLAYLMSSGSVLPEVYTSANRDKILRAFYDRFKAKTQVYKDYSYEQFEREYTMMTTVLFVYYVGMGAAYWQGAAFRNELPGRVELGGKGATEADLAPEELRQRMWWRKALANFRENFKAFDQYRYLQSLPDNLAGLGEWVELPDHLK